MAVVGRFCWDHQAMEEPTIPTQTESTPVRFARPNKPHHRVLVVEDNSDLRGLNAKVLMNSGYDVDAAEDGAVAWDKLQLNRYDLLLTDNGMPNLSGVELLEKMYGARLALPVIMASALLPSEMFTKCPWLQPAATLLKPYTFEELLETVRDVLRATEAIGQAPVSPPIWPSQPSTDRLQLELIPTAGPVTSHQAVRPSSGRGRSESTKRGLG